MCIKILNMHLLTVLMVYKVLVDAFNLVKFLIEYLVKLILFVFSVLFVCLLLFFFFALNKKLITVWE